MPLRFSERRILMLYVKINFIEAAIDCAKEDYLLNKRRFDITILSSLFAVKKIANR